MIQEDRSDIKSALNVRVIIMLACVFAIVAGLWATDSNGELPLMGRCLVLGSGRAWIPSEPMDFDADFFGMTYKGNTQHLIDLQVYAFGGYEKHVLFAMRDAVAKTRGLDEAVFLDVGANVGHHSMFMSRQLAHVHAIEPFPPVLARFDEMIALNKLENITVHRVGYSNEPGSLPFFAPPEDNHGSGTFAHAHAAEDKPAMELPLVVGDDHLRGEGIERVDLIKIDIEGFERFAFQGLRATIEANKPIIVFELNAHTDGGFRTAQELEQTFPPGYKFFEIHGPPDIGWKFGGAGKLVCGSEEGQYRLAPYDMTFSESGGNLIGVPADNLPALGLE